MQSPTACTEPEHSYLSLGKRRGKPTTLLAHSPLDISWDSAVDSRAPPRASYPSPPMSGSPRRNPDSSGRGHGSYGSSGQDAFRENPTSQPELGRSQAPPLRGVPGGFSQQFLQPQAQYQQHQQHQQQPQQLVYPPIHPPGQYMSQPVHQHQLPPPHLTYTNQGIPFSSDQTSGRESSEFASPKAQRKTKGHVASACVPCKRAHLRCDAQRPCSRCLSNGKEDACVDVQHKKRGRPRLRDEREPRFEGMGQAYPPPPDSMRRPLSMYSHGEAGISGSQPSSYRVLKSQGGGIGSQMSSRQSQYLEHATPADANIMYTARGIQQAEPICAYLTMDMQIIKASQGFAETLGVPSIVTRKLSELVGNDRDKVYRVQRMFEDERREREPNYLPPIVPRFEGDYGGDRVIQSVPFGAEELRQIQLDRQEILSFPGADGQQRSIRFSFGLAKKDSTYFIVMLAHIPPMPPQSAVYQPAPYASYPREPQYGYSNQQVYQQNPSTGPASFMQNPQLYGGPQSDVAYRTPGPLGQNIPPSNVPISPYGQQVPRTDYPQNQPQFRQPRSDMPQTPMQVQMRAPAQAQVPPPPPSQTQPQGQSQHQRVFQLPPIRDQLGEGSVDSNRPKDDRGRFDIGGLIEKPDPAGRN